MPAPISTPSASATPPKTINVFPQTKVRRLLGITTQQMNHWERLRLVEPQLHDQKKVYTFADLIALKTIKQLTRRGLPATRLRNVVEAFRRQMQAAGVPLAELRILHNGRSIAVEHDGLIVDPISGQMHLRLEGEKRENRLEVMPKRSAEKWLALALQCEGNPELRDQAIQAYRHVIEGAPDWVEPYINLGTLLFEQGDRPGAVACYRQAVAVDTESALAHFNLGTALDELKETRAACEHLRMAVRLQPDLADAHYNLARVYDSLGHYRLALPHWRRYLELDPHSSWSEIVRQRLTPVKSLQLRH